MTWSISVSATNKAAAKLEVTRALGSQMLAAGQKPHARDFNAVQAVAHSAIDTCDEGAISVVGHGHLNGDWVDGDMPNVRGVVIHIEAYSSPQG